MTCPARRRATAKCMGNDWFAAKGVCNKCGGGGRGGVDMSWDTFVKAAFVIVKYRGFRVSREPRSIHKVRWGRKDKWCTCDTICWPARRRSGLHGFLFDNTLVNFGVALQAGPARICEYFNRTHILDHIESAKPHRMPLVAGERRYSRAIERYIPPL